jgi:hydroxyacylglutathione hydrolase
VSAARLEVLTIVSPAFGQNGYVVRRPGGREAIAIDPGAESGAMADWADAAGCTITDIVLTHAHLDHIEGVGNLVARTNAPVWLHPADRPLYDTAPAQAAMFGMRVSTLPPPNREIVAGQPLELAGIRFDVRHAPGHAPGHVVLYVEDAGLAFVGDVVFQGSIGRTDLPGGSYQELMDAIRSQVLTLPDETRLYTGHGPETSVGHERATNPFLIAQFGGGLA